MKMLALPTLALFLTACATGTGGVVSVGQDQYMIGGLGGMTDYSGSVVKARFIGQASEFCARKGQAMELVTSTGQDATQKAYASAEVQFRCVAKSS